MFLWLMLLTGIIYPLIITGIAQLAMRQSANGDFLEVNGKIVGSSLIAQKFQNEKYFWPRPSAIDYNPLPSGGSNLGPTSAALKKAVEERKAALLKASGGTDVSKIPSELLYASGSGLDPHISPSTAYFQIDRIMKARGITSREPLEKLIQKHTKERFLGFIGEPCTNVLQLNLALDQAQHP